MNKADLRRAAKKVVPYGKLKRTWRYFRTGNELDEISHISHSQEGEDMALRNFLNQTAPGFYVDVGAHHPRRYSNSFYFYSNGWRGILVEADPAMVALLVDSRPRDIVVPHGAGRAGELDFYRYNDPAVNTFDADLVKQRKREDFGHEVVETIKIRVQPLAEIMAEHLPAGTDIDFLSVDVEGKDLEVLKTNDWRKYRPKLVVAESIGLPLKDLFSDPVVKFMAEVGYEPIAKLRNSMILQDMAS